MDHLLELLHSEYYYDILDVDLQMVQSWLVVTHPSKFYTVSTVLLHIDREANVEVTNCMSHLSIFVPTNNTVKLENGNTGHEQVIWIVLFTFTNCSIIYPVGPVYYYPYNPSNTISSGALKFYVSFQRVAYEPLGHCGFVEPQGHSWRSPYHTQNNIEYFQIEILKFNPQRIRNFFVPSFCSISKQHLFQIIH